MLVRDVMSHSPAWISPAVSVGDASLMMMNRNLDCLPVKDNERLIGMITERDIAFSTALTVASRKDLTVRDIMSVEVMHCFDDQNIHDASDIMRRRHLWGLPVFNNEERLVGTISLEKVLLLSAGRAVASPIAVERNSKMADEWIAQYMEFHGGSAPLETSAAGDDDFLPWTFRYLEFQGCRD